MVKIQVYYASVLVLTIATSSALAQIGLGGREGILRQRDLDQKFSRREYRDLDARNIYDDFEARGFSESLGKVKKFFQPKKSTPKPVYESLPDRLRKMGPSQLDLAKVESHLAKTAGILWGIRRRDFDGGNIDFLVERAFDDLD